LAVSVALVEQLIGSLGRHDLCPVAMLLDQQIGGTPDFEVGDQMSAYLRCRFHTTQRYLILRCETCTPFQELAGLGTCGDGRTRRWLRTTPDCTEEARAK